MSTGVRVPAADAFAVATVLTTRLAQSCSRIEIAGSLRRRSPDVGDVELVAESLTHFEPSGLFFRCEGGTTTRCEVIPTPTEEAFFEAIGVRWIAPEHR